MIDVHTHTHSDAWNTETEAFNKAAKSASSIKLSILYEIDKAGAVRGLTPDEFVLMHGGLINTIRRRFTDLWKEGKICHHPNGLTRENNAGNACVTWIIGNDPVGIQQRRKRKWVGLTDEDLDFWGGELGLGELGKGVLRAVNAHLKEKNCD